MKILNLKGSPFIGIPKKEAAIQRDVWEAFVKSLNFTNYVNLTDGIIIYIKLIRDEQNTN